MKYRRFLLALGLVAMLAGPAPAGIFFWKHTKPNPAERVPQLLLTLKTDSDDSKRVSAAKELREFDPSAFPEMVPVLIDVLRHDQKTSVRLEVVQSLGKLRPISQEAGMALEEAVNDSSWRVRWQARQTLLGYRLSGYRSPGKPEEASRVPPGPPVKRGPASKTKSGLVPNETAPPPLADPPQATPAPEPVPKAPSNPMPVETPKLQTPPPRPAEEGPDLPLGN